MSKRTVAILHYAAPPIVGEVLRASGQPLARGDRAFMESRFGRDFSRVRVHRGPRALQSARALRAAATCASGQWPSTSTAFAVSMRLRSTRGAKISA